ncbi:MAG: acyl-CoA carboxylase subunit beta [Planctomycetota bacterium]|nr:acyl-CoA carboxylase subunit beta [Planctomycetota bacterium]
MSKASPSTPPSSLRDLTVHTLTVEAKIRDGGGKAAIDRQHEKGRLTARERIALLVDGGQVSGAGHGASGDEKTRSAFQELGLWAAHEMYKDYGGAPAAGVVTGIGRVDGKLCMIIANDATVKAGAFFPMTCKKIIRAQVIAQMARLPLIYLVDSAGVFLPLQEDVFPDTDDFGRIFRNNAVISAEGIPQIAAIMGYCVAGGGYLPVLCDTLLMTEGSGLYLAGPALVKAAIGQEVTDEELGGATMHASISGTIDFKEKDDENCIERLRSLVQKYGPARVAHEPGTGRGAPARDPEDVYRAFTDKPGGQYDIKDVIACIVDVCVEGDSLRADFDEYKAEYGQSLVCGYAVIGGHACGIVANQKKLVQRSVAGGKAGPTKAVQMPGVIYDDSADKAARFIMDCNQRKIPIIFLHDTTGFMVGRDSEQGGIIRAGAKMVNAMSNCIVPKIVVIMGGSYGAGNYAMCGRAFDQFLSFAWPNAKCAVMGANQATGVLTQIEEASRKRKGETIDEAAHEKIYGAIHAAYTEQAAITHAAARGWVDRIIEPHRTREELIAALDAAAQGWDYSRAFKTGVLQT